MKTIVGHFWSHSGSRTYFSTFYRDKTTKSPTLANRPQPTKSKHKPSSSSSQSCSKSANKRRHSILTCSLILRSNSTNLTFSRRRIFLKAQNKTILSWLTISSLRPNRHQAMTISLSWTLNLSTFACRCSERSPYSRQNAHKSGQAPTTPTKSTQKPSKWSRNSAPSSWSRWTTSATTNHQSKWSHLPTNSDSCS